MFIYRGLLSKLREHLSNQDISLILGPRQAGKTTLILKLKEELEQKGEKVAYLNLDRFEDLEFFQTQKALLERIQLEFGQEKVYVLIDEIQRLKNAGLFLKGLYDYLTPHKFIVTGSGSLELKEDIVEPLTGRKKIFYLHPLSFAEFFEFKTQEKIVKFRDWARLKPYETERVLNEYLLFGGYPKVVAAASQSEKEQVLQEIYLSYLEKDVRALLGVVKDLSYQYLLRYLAAETGSLFKKSEVARNLTLNIKTLNRYLFLLEKTFIIKLVQPFFRNPTKELTKTPKVYFIDLGLRNFILANFKPFAQREDRGKIFENFVFRQILDLAPPFGVFFWRTEAGAEVDFVLQNHQLLPIEAKVSKEKIGVVGKSLSAFLQKYPVDKAIIVHLGQEGKVQKNHREIVYHHALL